MEQSEIILEMIETVSPDDAAKLDEIDARVWLYLKPWRGTFKLIEYYTEDLDDIPPDCEPNDTFWLHLNEEVPDFPGCDTTRTMWPEWCVVQDGSYTRSRDALKAIRPDGWDFIDVYGGYNHNKWIFNINMGSFNTKGAVLPTEELAELHAIIQTIEYERSKSAS